MFKREINLYCIVLYAGGTVCEPVFELQEVEVSK